MVMIMAKQGMKRPDVTHPEPKNQLAAVPEMQGKAKLSAKKANPVISGTKAPSLKVYHSRPHGGDTADRPMSEAYSEIDTDLGRDNLENDIPYADMQDL